jgi:hypothetical protein
MGTTTISQTRTAPARNEGRSPVFETGLPHCYKSVLETAEQLLTEIGSKSGRNR